MYGLKSGNLIDQCLDAKTQMFDLWKILILKWVKVSVPVTLFDIRFKK